MRGPAQERAAHGPQLRDFRSEDLVRAGGARAFGHGLRMTARLRTFGDVTLGRVHGEGCEVERLDRSDAPVSYDITYVVRGGFEYLDGRSWIPLAGPVKMGPTGLPHRMRLSGSSTFLFARIATSQLLPSVVELPDTFRAYRCLTLADRALAGLIASVLDDEHDTADWERALVERNVVDLAGGLFRGRLGRPVSAPSPQDAIRDRARAIIDRRAADPGLDPRRIAEEIGISLRQLQAIFARAESSLGAEIRLGRTRLAHAILTDPAQDRLKLSQVARLSGFGSIDSLRRALEARYGAGPTELRTGRSRSGLSSTGAPGAGG